MSSDQYSEKPLPRRKNLCPHCGEPIRRRGKVCWLCRQKSQEPPGHRTPPVPLIEKSDNKAWMALGILGVLLIAGLLFEGPGLLVATVIIVLLAMAHSHRATVFEERHTRMVKETDVSADVPADEDHESEFIASATARNTASGCAVALILSVVFFVTFCAVCTAAFLK